MRDDTLLPPNRRLRPLPWLDLKIKRDSAGRVTVSNGDVERSCGDCTACCTIMPVAEMGKPGYKRCTFERSAPATGCAIYASRPRSCVGWSCYWLLDDGIPEELRPDRAHVVVDMMADKVVAIDNDTGKKTPVNVVQMWLDPAYPDAYKAPLVRDLMAEIADKTRMATLVRCADGTAFTVAAPSLTAGGAWYESPREPKVAGRG